MKGSSPLNSWKTFDLAHSQILISKIIILSIWASYREQNILLRWKLKLQTKALYETTSNTSSSFLDFFPPHSTSFKLYLCPKRDLHTFFPVVTYKTPANSEQNLNTSFTSRLCHRGIAYFFFGASSQNQKSMIERHLMIVYETSKDRDCKGKSPAE